MVRIKESNTMKSAYPVFITEHNNDYLVFVPDFEIYTEGKSVTDAMEMAKADTEIFDYSQGIVTMVDIDFSEYRKRHNNRRVKKTLV